MSHKQQRPIHETEGGTGQISYDTGDILYASDTNELSKLTPGMNGRVLTLDSGIPSWQISNCGFVPAVQGGGTINIGFSFSNSVFTIHSADGTSLSSNNPGYVIIPSNSVGQPVIFKVTDNFSFEDASGTSTLAGNTFGTTESVAWSGTMPMYIYFSLNDSGDEIVPMLSRIPHKTETPIESNIGMPSSANADTQTSMWSFENITASEWEGTPCICVGSFRTTKSSSDEWVVQPLFTTDGIGNFNENILFSYPTGQNGAESGTHFLSNAGTIPIFDVQNYSYHIERSGYIQIHITYATVVTSGVGSQDLAFTIPLNNRFQTRPMNFNMYWMDASSSNARFILIPHGADSNNRIFMFENGGTSFVVNSLFQSGDRINAEGWIKILR